uniref:Putative integrase family protein n=1 Tax=viral metagenome TaxID=1070528 RepID=A0A6M3M3X6_9ZZZZ
MDLPIEVEVSLRGPRSGEKTEWRMPTRARWYPLYEEDEDFKLWFDNNARGSPTTAIERARVLFRFIRLMGWSLDELTDQIKDDRDRFEKLLMSFVGQQEKAGYAPGTISSYIKAVKSWTNWHSVQLVRKIKISNGNSTPTLDDEKVPTVHQVQDIRSSATPRGRICVGAVAYGGMRPQVLGHQHYKDGLELRDLPELDIESLKFETFPTLVVVRPELSKTGHKYRTFFPKETCRDIVAFLEKRLSHGENLTERSALASVNPNLKRGQWGYDHDPENRHIRETIVSRDIRTAMRPLYDYRPYVLRSYFSTRLLMAVSDGVLDNQFRTFWMGHSGTMAARYSSNKSVLPEDLIENMREAYRRSRRYLLGDTLNEDDLRRKQMLDTARMLGFGEEKLSKLKEVLERSRTVDEAVEEFQKLREPPKPSNGGYDIVTGEAEMLKKLNEGWSLERGLDGDKFLMKRN